MFAAATLLRRVAVTAHAGGPSTATALAAGAVSTVSRAAASTSATSFSPNHNNNGPMKPEAGTETGIASGPAATQVRGGAGAAVDPTAAAAADPLSGKVHASSDTLS